MSCPWISRDYSHSELILKFLLSWKLIAPLLYFIVWVKTISASTPKVDGAKRKRYQSSANLVFSYD